MTYLYGGEKPSLADMEHHGVKGMKWGVVRKNLGDIHAEKVRRGMAINQRVASGQGSAGDKARVVLGSSVGRLATKGLKGTAAKNLEDQKQHLKRLDTGKATVNDLLSKYGSLTAIDIGNAALRSRQQG